MEEVKFTRDTGIDKPTVEKKSGGFFSKSSVQVKLPEGTKLEDMSWSERKELAREFKRKTGEELPWSGKEGKKTFKAMGEDVKRAEKYTNRENVINSPFRESVGGNKEVEAPPSRGDVEDLPDSGSSADDDADRKAA